MERFSSESFEALQSVAPAATWRNVNQVNEVRGDEWDMLVTTDDWVAAPDHMYIVSVGGQWFGSYNAKVGGGWRNAEVVAERMSNATEFAIPEGLEAEVARLVEQRLLPAVRGRETNRVLHEKNFRPMPSRGTQSSYIVPFLVTTEPMPVAGYFRREGDTGAEVWCLPEGMDITEWTFAALQVWHRGDPSTFPLDPGWRTSIEWQSADEQRLQRELDELQEQRERIMADLDLKQVRIAGALGAAHDNADAGLRRLLTAQGDDLVAAVEAALGDLGLGVSNRDEVNPEHDRREDLWVTMPGDQEWVAIAEVRGYSKGAAGNDLLRLARFVRRYGQEFAREPTRQWYIVNQFAGTDPGTRPQVLHKAPEVETFEEDNGLIIDTVDLFKVCTQVALGEIDAADVRTNLRGVGRFTPPS